MMPVLGAEVAIVKCSNPLMVGVRGTVVLESMRMLTIATTRKKVEVAKVGTVLQLKETGRLVIADEMSGRLEDRLARGSSV
ncbi:MAG: ribonuclease P protein subunit [Nitrososphaerales archaeon]|jgi:RNase P/RNase MRP subunit p29